jgi:membrane protein
MTAPASRRWREVLARLERGLSREEVTVVAASVAFYAFLPRILPPNAFHLMRDELAHMSARSHQAIGAGALSAVLAIWSSSKGIRTLISAAFSFYVARAGHGDPISGSLAAVITLLGWFLLGAYAVLVGAELAAALESAA